MKLHLSVLLAAVTCSEPVDPAGDAESAEDVRDVLETCPQVQPASGEACGPSAFGCTYGDTCCICDAEGLGSCGMGQVTCFELTANDPACPASAPADQTECEAEGLICRYCTDDARPLRVCSNGRFTSAPLACPGR